MRCIPEEVALLYADDEISRDDAVSLESHLRTCGDCRGFVERLREENRAIEALLIETVPDRRRRIAQHLVAAMAASFAVAVPAQWAASRLNDVWTWTNHVAAIPFELMFRSARFLLPAIALVLLTQSASYALERRAGDVVVIGADETIADTLMATGQKVLIEGKVQGNVLMFGRSLELRGEVDGDVFAAGQDVRITGRVTGNLIAAAETVTMEGALSGNFIAAGRNVQVRKGADVQHDAITASETVTIDGAVGRGLIAAGSTGVVEGSVGRGITFAGNKLLIRSGGTVGGDIVANVPARNGVEVQSGAAVAGNVRTQIRPAAPNRWLQAGTYVWEFIAVLAAFIAGWVLFSLFPGFSAGAVQRASNPVSAGFGFLTLIIAPIAAIIVCFTIIGLPLGLATLFFYGLGLYLAQVVVAGYLGREIMGRKPGTALPTLLGLLAGLAILHVLFLIPVGGGILRFLVTIFGLGGLVLQLNQSVRSRPAAA